MYLTIGPVTNPGQTSETGSFQVETTTDEGELIELIDKGIIFIPKAGELTGVELVSNNPYINQEDVTFTFTLTPNDSFTSIAIWKLTLPQ
jgi:hypothetical protein